MKIELPISDWEYIGQYVREHGDMGTLKDIEFAYEHINNSYMCIMSSASYKRFIGYICTLLIEGTELDEELFSIYTKIKRQEILYEQSLRHTINSKPLIIGDEGAYQYIEAMGRALTYSQHALTKHQINLIDTIIARISGQE